MGIVEILLLLAAWVTLVPALVFFLECVVASLPFEADEPPLPEGPRPRTAILVPAHDEEDGIGPTVASLKAQLGPGDRLIVIADNCSDATAARAREAGAEVLERTDAEKRGKGYALSFGAHHLESDPPDVVVIVDADCRLSDGGLEKLARTAVATNRPIQADYLLQAPPTDDTKSLISGLALLVKNRVRAEGLRRMGLPTHLTGSGMAFPWAVYRSAPATESWLVEDLLMGLELALLGHPPLYLPSVRVTSELPTGDKAALGQRRRWEHGVLATMRSHAPKMIGAGLARGKLDLIALGLDLIVLPLALLVMLIGAQWVVAMVFGALTGRWSPAGASGTAMALVGVGVAVAWAAYGRKIIPLSKLLFVPIYVLWKVPLYVAYAVKGRHKSWERTARKS